MGNPLSGGFSAVINGIEHVGQSMEELVGKATSELTSLGIGAFGGAGAFIQFLIHEGEDPVHVISTLWSHTIGHGAEPSSTLEELANGVLTVGPVNYCTQKANQAVAPIKNALTEHNSRAQQVAQVHQTTLNVTQNKLNTLTGNASTANLPMTWQGPSADAMVTSLGGITRFIEQLNEQMYTNGQQIALNNAFIQGLELTGTVARDMAILDLLLVGVDAVILVVTGAAAGVGALAGAAIDVLLDAGVLALELEILAAMVAIDALIWLVGTIAIYVTTHPISLPSLTLPMSKPTNIPERSELPPRKTLKDFTPGQKQLLDDLAKEFGWENNAQMKAWLEYLIGMYGTANLPKLKAMIRCLYYKGYFNPQQINPSYRDQSATPQIQKIWNTITNALKPHDLEGGWKEYHGMPSGANHFEDINGTIRALLNAIQYLDGKIADPRTPENIRNLYQSLRDTVQSTYDFVIKKINGITPPTRWPDQGNVPFSSDVFKNSGCDQAMPTP